MLNVQIMVVINAILQIDNHKELLFLFYIHCIH